MPECQKSRKVPTKVRAPYVAHWQDTRLRHEKGLRSPYLGWDNSRFIDEHACSRTAVQIGEANIGRA